MAHAWRLLTLDFVFLDLFVWFGFALGFVAAFVFEYCFPASCLGYVFGVPFVLLCCCGAPPS